jgi:hypothetical protein
MVKRIILELDVTSAAIIRNKLDDGVKPVVSRGFDDAVIAGAITELKKQTRPGLDVTATVLDRTLADLAA